MENIKTASKHFPLLPGLFFSISLFSHSFAEKRVDFSKIQEFVNFVCFFCKDFYIRFTFFYSLKNFKSENGKLNIFN